MKFSSYWAVWTKILHETIGLRWWIVKA